MNRIINVRPVVWFVSKHVGSGPNRLKMVRLWHDLDKQSFHSELPDRTTISD
jgi:hypothetical protein